MKVTASVSADSKFGNFSLWPGLKDEVIMKGSGGILDIMVIVLHIVLFSVYAKEGIPIYSCTVYPLSGLWCVSVRQQD